MWFRNELPSLAEVSLYSILRCEFFVSRKKGKSSLVLVSKVGEPKQQFTFSWKKNPWIPFFLVKWVPQEHNHFAFRLTSETRPCEPCSWEKNNRCHIWGSQNGDGRDSSVPGYDTTCFSTQATDVSIENATYIFRVVEKSGLVARVFRVVQ